LTESHGIDRQQKQIKEKRRDVAGERAKDNEECAARIVGDASGNLLRHKQVTTKEKAAIRADKVANLVIASAISSSRLNSAS